MTPILARDSSTDDTGYFMHSYHFRDGTAQRSGNGGRSGRPMYSSYPEQHAVLPARRRIDAAPRRLATYSP